MADLAAGDREHDGRLHRPPSGRRRREVAVTGAAPDPSDAARQADPASRRDAAPRARARPSCPVSRCRRSTPRRRTCRCGSSSAASARAQLCPEPAPRPGGSAAAANRLARGRRLRRAGRRAGSRRAGAGRHLQGLRGSLRGHPGRRDRRTSTLSPGSMPTATCGCSSSSAGRCRPMPRLRRSPARCSGTCPRAATAASSAACACATAAAGRCGSTTHADEKAELLRAAICDDEVLQAIGRGRGVNRTAANPLEVHVLADVALPLVHDEIVAWETVAPDLFQRMLLAGIAVDSPSRRRAAPSCAVLRREAGARRPSSGRDLSGQNPISNLYREMSLKSAAYRRPGRGRSWQRAWWIDGNAR